MVKPPLRTKSIGFKVSEEEYARLETAAQASGRTLGEWCREAILRGGSASDDPALAEIVGVRLLLVNVLRPLAAGEKLAPEAFDKTAGGPHLASTPKTNLVTRGCPISRVLCEKWGGKADRTVDLLRACHPRGNLSGLAATGQLIFNRTYTYDSLNRLQSMSAPGDTCSGLTYTIDPWGNRTAQNPTGGTCYAPNVGVTAQNRLSGAPYQYDAAGNMTNDGNHTYTYDAENRVTQVDGGVTATYVYDAFGQRVDKMTSGRDEEYIYDKDGHTNTVLNNGTFERMYVNMNGQPLAEYFENTTYFIHSDHLGSTRLLTKLDQTVRESDDYYPYGEQLPPTGGTGDPLKFTGKERDAESGLDYFEARHYASTLGRFMSVDPVIITPERKVDPQQLNRYAYVRNNPLRFVDPTGEILQLSGDLTADMAALCSIVGSGNCDRISINEQNNTVSFNTSGLDLSANEGTALVNQLVTSSDTYGFALSDTANTAGGPVKLANDPISNLDNQPDVRYSKKQTDLPPNGVSDQVTIDPKTAHFTDSQGRSVSLSSLAFHELAEAYAKIDGGKQYVDFQNLNVVNGTTVQIGPPQQGAHNEAVQREFKLREQRPNLQSSGRAGDQLIRDPHN